jgi:hypothetical protein
LRNPARSHGELRKVAKAGSQGRTGATPSNSSPSNSSPSTRERGLRAELARLGANEREVDFILAKIKNDPGIRYPTAYLRTALGNGDGPDHIAEARRELATADAGTPVQDDRPPWCGKCDRRTRLIEVSDDMMAHCPDCHPSVAKDEP